jgi:hypothetical protein
LIRQADTQTFTSVTSECNGADQTVVDSRTCNVDIKTLRADPFFLSFDDFILVTVNSQNAFGWSKDSQPSTSQAQIQTEPIKMLTPYYHPLLSPGTQNYISITQLTTHEELGGSPVSGYSVYFSFGTDTTYSYLFTGTITDFDQS